LSINYLCGAIFFFLGIGFGVTGIMTNRRLKSHFSEFYNENTFMLQAATYGLSIPMILRGLNDFMTRYSKDYHDLIFKYNVAFEVIFYVFLELPVIAFQLSSLVYGYIRRKNTKTKRGETFKNDIDDLK
jgi:H+/Cl- antiporter ClcA